MLRTLAVQDCLDSEGIQRVVWPARSPDLNPIENVWDALGRQVAGRNYPPTNKNTLIRTLTEEWDKLPQQLLDTVVQSMKSNLTQSSNIPRAKKVARFNETFPQAKLRRLGQASHRAAETPEQSQARRQRHAEYLSTQRTAETREQSQAWHLQKTTYMTSQRDTETIEAAESRKRAVAERSQQRCQIFTRVTCVWRGVFDKTAFEYDEILDYESHKLIKIETMNKECRFCGVFKWKEESVGMCCSGGGSRPSFNRRAR
ncbi:uncharacterized protein TNCV_3824721 [Trichonephila clavipes]|nr:uncharacterized protein TNCV_3824721 [Trichonephila clavipes]